MCLQGALISRGGVAACSAPREAASERARRVRRGGSARRCGAAASERHLPDWLKVGAAVALAWGGFIATMQRNSGESQGLQR